MGMRDIREEATGNLCLGIKDLVQEKVSGFFVRLTSSLREVKRHCRTLLQSEESHPDSLCPANVHPILALV